MNCNINLNLRKREGMNKLWKRIKDRTHVHNNMHYTLHIISIKHNEDVRVRTVNAVLKDARSPLATGRNSPYLHHIDCIDYELFIKS